MTELIYEIADSIENWIDENIQSPEIRVKNWGFAELAYRDSKGKTKTSNQPIPMTINGTGERKQIALDDKKDFIYWVRWVSPATTRESEEDSWGLRVGKRDVLPIRIVIAHRVELGEDLVFRVLDGLPENLVLTGYDFVFLNRDWSIDPDHETIYRTELGETEYEKHRFTWNVYAINLNVEFLRCL